MGSYLQIGIVTTIEFPKVQQEKEVDKEQVLLFLQEKYQINVNLYDMTEEDGEYILSLRDEFLTSHLVSFLETQFSYMDSNEHREKEWQTLKPKLEEMTVDEMKELAEDNYYCCFAKSSARGYYRNPNVWFETAPIDIEMIVYHTEGKVIAEQFSDARYYFLKLLRLAGGENPLSHTTHLIIE